MPQQQKHDLPPFIYEPLASGQIRLLMPAADDDDGLIWTMRVVSIDDELEFDALSYVWGSQDQTFPIQCNGQRHFVHHNLHTALPYLARRNTYRQAWKKVPIRLSSGESAIKDDVSSDTAQEIENRSGEIRRDRWEGDSDTEEINRHKNDEHDEHTWRTANSGKGHIDSGIEEGGGQNERDSGSYSAQNFYQTGDTRGWEKAPSQQPVHVEPLRPIWIDALCINQGDEEEKSVQMSSMNQIYRKAETVWVWLGLAKNQDFVPDAIDLLPLLASLAHHASQHGSVQESFEDTRLAQTDKIIRQSLSHIICNEWFRRVWIFQEYVLAASAVFLCGRLPIDEELVMEALHQSWKFSEAFKRSFEKSFGSMEHAKTLLQAKTSLLTWVCKADVRHQTDLNSLAFAMLRNSESTNIYRDCLLPQDRVFGILGVLTPEQCHALGADLFGIIDTADLYTKFSAAMLPLALCNLDLSFMAWRWLDYALKKEVDIGLPSWVPDLHHSFVYGATFANDCKASGRQRMATNGQQIGELIIRGTIVHTIISISATVPVLLDEICSETALEDLADLAQWEEEAHEFCTGLGHVQSRVHALSTAMLQQKNFYLQILVSEWKLRHGPKRDLYQSYAAWFVALRKFSRNYKKLLASELSTPMNPWVVRLLKRTFNTFDILRTPSTRAGDFGWRVQSTLRYRQLFRTTDEAFGSATKGILPGDKVCVFNGAPKPYILRRVVDRTDEAYRLVGNAYVPTLMNGEVDEMNLPDQDILLV